jgi:hypothetical protein
VTEERRFELLRELGRLLARFGPESFANLAAYLREPGTVADLSEILDRVAEAGRQRGRSRREGSQRPSNLRGWLSALREREPVKGALIGDFYDAVVSRQVLPTLGELRRFASDNGLGPVNATSRDKAVGPLVRALASRSEEEIRSFMARIAEVGKGGDRTLQGWADLILRKHQ